MHWSSVHLIANNIIVLYLIPARLFHWLLRIGDAAKLSCAMLCVHAHPNLIDNPDDCKTWGHLQTHIQYSGIQSLVCPDPIIKLQMLSKQGP